MDLFALDANAFLLLAPPPSLPLSGFPPPPGLQFVVARQGRLTSFRLANFQDYLPVLSSTSSSSSAATPHRIAYHGYVPLEYGLQPAI